MYTWWYSPAFRENKEFEHIITYLLALLIPTFYLAVKVANYNTIDGGISNSNNKSNIPSTNVIVDVKKSGIKLSPWFVTGFADAESSFSMSVFKSKTAAICWTIEPCFIITLHKKDIELLNKIQLFFGVG